MSIASPGPLSDIAAAIRAEHAPEAPSLAESHLEALGPQEVIYDSTATPAQGRNMLFDQLEALLTQVESEPTYAGLAVDVVYNKENNQLLCIRLVPVDVLTEGAEPSRRIAA